MVHCKSTLINTYDNTYTMKKHLSLLDFHVGNAQIAGVNHNRELPLHAVLLTWQ